MYKASSGVLGQGLRATHPHEAKPTNLGIRVTLIRFLHHNDLVFCPTDRYERHKLRWLISRLISLIKFLACFIWFKMHMLLGLCHRPNWGFTDILRLPNSIGTYPIDTYCLRTHLNFHLSIPRFKVIWRLIGSWQWFLNIFFQFLVFYYHW